MIDHLRAALDETIGNVRALEALIRSGVVRPVRPDRLLWMAAGVLWYGFTLAAGYAAGAARHPDRTAIIDDEGELSYAEVAARTDQLARAFARLGLAAGQRVGLICRNHRWAIEVQVAAGKLGADVVLLNTGLSATQLAEVAAELELRLLVADPEFDATLRELPPACTTVNTDAPLETLISDGGAAALPLWPPTGQTILLTSGTTGTPKGARRPTPSSIAPAGAILQAIPLHAGEPVFIAAPLLHAWGLGALQLAVLHGAPVALTRRFDPSTMLTVVERVRCEAVFAVPVMLARALELSADQLDTAWLTHRPRSVVVSGSALPAELATAFMDRFGDVLYNLYGSTEVSWVSIAGPTDLREAPGTAGRAPAGTRLLILDDDGHEVPTGTDGRVFVGNGMPFDGYTRAGADVERHGELLGTGDIGHLDTNGRLHLTGRGDDMIVSGGENVHPGPVEDLLTARPEVREAAVVGVPDEQYGQRLAAYVVPTPGAAIDEDEVRGWVRAALSRFAVPRDVVLLDELPRNATGKILRRDLPHP